MNPLFAADPLRVIVYGFGWLSFVHVESGTSAPLIEVSTPLTAVLALAVLGVAAINYWLMKPSGRRRRNS
jgi:hypothetical protein